MQIAFCIFKFFPHGGIPRDLMKIARESLARGHRVRIYAARWEGERPADMEVVELAVGGLTNHGRNRRFVEAVQAHLRGAPADLVVGMNKMPGLDVYYAGDSCYEEKSRTQRSRIYRLSPRYRHFAEFERAVFDAAMSTEILTISDVEVGHFRRHYGTAPERFHPLPPGIDPDRRAPPDRQAKRSAFRREFGIGDHEHLLLFLGSGFIKKGLDRALTGLAALPQDLARRTRMFVVGHDDPGRFRRLARRLGVAERVTFFPGRDDVPRFLFGADALVLPAYDENAGMVIVEAIIAGLPALVTGNCGYAHYVEEADAGLVTPMPFRQDTFNAQLEELLSSPRRPEWQRNGLALGEQPRLYRLAPVAVDHLEAFAAQRRGGTDLVEYAPVGHRVRVFLRADLAAAWGREGLFARVAGLEGEVYRAVARRRTLRFETEGRAYFAKIHQGVGWAEIAKNLITARLPVTGARNEYHACLHLERRGIAAPTVAAFGERGANPATRFSFVVCDALEGRVSLEDVTDAWHLEPPAPREVRRLVMAVADFARKMHAAGVVHRDFYICHLLADAEALGRGEVKLAVLDLHRAHVHDRIPRRWLRRDLAALLYSTLDLPLSRRARLRFLRVYRGRPLRQVMHEEGAFWHGVHRRAVALYRKGRRKGLVAGRFQDGS